MYPRTLIRTHRSRHPRGRLTLVAGLTACLALPCTAQESWQAWTTGSQELVPLRPVLGAERHAADRAESGVRLDLFRGEAEAFQIVLTPGTATSSLADVHLVFDPLVSADESLDAGHFEWFRVGYFNQSRPDILLPVSGFETFTDDIYNYPMWVRLEVPRAAVPGLYRGQVRVEANSGTVATIPLTVKVWQTAIPRQARFNTMFFGFAVPETLGRLLTLHLGVRNSAERRQILSQEAQVLADHRITHDNDSIGAIPYYPPQFDPLTPEGQEEVMRWCEFWTSRGLRLTSSFRILNSNQYASDPDRVERARRFYSVYAPLLRERGWADMVYTVIVDEFRGIAAATNAAATGLFLKSLMPELTIAATGMSQGRGRPETNVDAYKIASQVVTTWATDPGYNLGPFRDGVPARAVEMVPKFLFERAAAGDRIWPYIHGSLDFTQDGYTVRSFFWQLSAHGFDGACLYSVTDWGTEKAHVTRPDRFGLIQDQAPEHPPPGVGVLFWPGDKRLLETVRLEQVRDGIEDWECFTMLDELLLRAYRDPGRYAAWAEQAEEVLRLRSGQVSPVTYRPSWGVFEHSTDEANFARARRALGEALDAAPAELRRPVQE